MAGTVQKLAELRRDAYLLHLRRQKLEWHYRYEMLHIKSTFPSVDFPREKNYYEDFSGIHALQMDRRLELIKRDLDQQPRALDYKIREMERQIKRLDQSAKKSQMVHFSQSEKLEKKQKNSRRSRENLETEFPKKKR